MTRLKLASVQYVNADPLTWGFRRGPFRDTFEVLQVPPSRIPDLLAAGRADAGLIPSIEYLRGPRPYGIVAGPAVTSRGPVASVAIYTRREPRDIRTIAMDSSSRTSVALATILLRREFRVTPQTVTLGERPEAPQSRL